jgi:hypothetical protein
MNFRKVLPLSLLALALLAPQAHALLTGRHGHTTTLLPDGNILILGGAIGAANTATNTGEIYSVSAAGFVAAPVMPNSVSSHTATLMGNGMVLVAGGFTAGVPGNAAAIYNPRTNAFTPVTATMVSVRGGHTATLINKGTNSGKVLICGGQVLADSNAAGSVTNTCEIFTPNTASPNLGTFAAVQSMSSERIGHSASAIAGGRVFVSGGRRWDNPLSTFTYLSTNEIYDPENNQWQAVTALTQGRTDHSAVVLNNGTIMISGGYNGVNKIDSPEEYWYKTAAGIESNQTAGTKGYLDSAEIFDSYGGRVPVSGSDYMVMPYRNSMHSAALTPDGKQHMYGGYGNIPPKFFSPSPVIEAGSFLNTSHVNIATASIDGSSMIRFVLDTTLSRKVDGRLVNADVFFSYPPDFYGASISVANAKIYLNRSTAVVDGMPVGQLTPGIVPGRFNNVVLLEPPAGRVVFSPVQVTGDATPVLNTLQTQFAFASPLQPQTPAVPLLAGSRLDMPLTFEVPPAYAGGVISGTITVSGGAVMDDRGFWIVNLTSGTGQFTSGVVGINVVTGMGIASGNISFPNIEGTITNSTVTPLTSVLFATANDAVSAVSLRALYTATRINISGLPYQVDKSTFVIREMIFADNLEYTPDQSSWVFGQPLYPTFNSSALITPAADAAILGGRNCEPNVANDCKRGVKTFTATAGYGAFISQNYTAWPRTGKLVTKRAFHTSTLLPDDRILTCGGSDGTATLDSCELFYPAEQVWKPAGTMNYPRSRHTATLLPNGRVLIAGGSINASTHAVKYAEIYYPDTDKWIQTNSMGFARGNHSATLLPDGNVLMAGGDTINGYSATSEIYLTTSSVWLTAGSFFNGGRAQHTATLLKDGNVLMTGGINGTGAMYTTELYNFATRAWTNTGNNLKVKRYGHTANLLMDGRVLVSGGSDGSGPLDSAEIYNGTSWQYTGNNMLTRRTNHRSTLLPNGKLMVTGGEQPGLAHSVVEGYDVDFSTWQSQGETTNRSNHTTILTSSGVLMAIGGWDGGQYLDSTESMYFSYYPDGQGFAPKDFRNPLISTGTALFDRGDRLTLLGNTSNFHGVSEASGGGAGSMNSSFQNPRVYLQQIDSQSGFMTDITTRVYTAYGGPNTAWEKTVSSITVITPSGLGEMPYGWYHVRVAANGQFSGGYPVQITAPRPVGTPTAPSGSVLGTSSVTWSWTSGSVASADGYSLYSSSNNVFITTITFGTPASFTQGNLQPNTDISVKVSAYNMGGSGSLAQSSTYYTLASTPSALTVNDASFTTATLEWASTNSPATTFEVSMCAGSNFSNPVLISTPIPFNLSYTSTSTVVDRLLTNTRYFFRVRAKNGAGIPTNFYPSFANPISTLTVADIGSLIGTATSSSTINWAWNSAAGADYYEIFDVTLDSANPVYVGSTTFTDYTQKGLGANRPYAIVARAVNNDPDPVYGPVSGSGFVYTLAGTPAPDPANIFTLVSTGSFTANWLTNDNSTWTVYGLAISTSNLYLSSGTVYTTTLGGSNNFSKLAANFRYFVKVAAINGDGIATDAVSLGSKYTLARPPAEVTPSTVELSGVTLTWSQNNNTPGTVYEVRGTTDTFTGLVTTYLPFGDLYTGAAHQMSGLLTSTTYYFDVTARNGEGILTSRTQAVPAAFTTRGPSGAPSGSIGGVSSPSSQVTISGTLPNNRAVTLTVPARSFPAPTAIAISSSVTNACGTYMVNSRTVEVAVYTQDNVQPEEPVTITISYDGFIVPSSDIYSLVLARYNPVSGQCLPLETKIDTGLKTITATLNHFSVFQLMLRTAASNLSDVLVYPNPFKPNRGHGFVTIANLPASAKLRVYTLAGTKVWEGTAGTTGIIIWRGVNDSGNQVASGVYLAVVDSSAGKKVLKLAIER